MRYILARGLPSVVFAFLLLVSGRGFAATFNVERSSDEPDKDPKDGLCQTAAGYCTLRAAVQQANARRGLDRIILPAGTFYPATGTAQGDSTGEGGFDITDDLSIEGAGAQQTTLTGGEARHRIFRVRNKARVTIKSLTLKQGRAEGDGSVIHNEGSLALVDVTVVDAGGSSAIYNEGGLLVVSGSRIQNNSRGIYSRRGRILIENSQFASNVFEEGDGAAIHATHAEVVVRSSSFHDNRAARGGAIYTNDILTVWGSKFEKNRAVGRPKRPGGGGAIYSAGGAFVYLKESRIEGNTTSKEGGGIFSAGRLVLRRTVVSGNSASAGKGGGIFSSPRKRRGEVSGSAGAPAGEELVVMYSLIASNQAKSGAGIYFSGTSAVVENSTFGANRAQLGGGLYNRARSDTAVTRLRNVTMGYNTAPAGRGSSIHNSKGTLLLAGSLLSVVQGGNNCSGSIGSEGYNIDADGSCLLDQDTDRISKDPLIARDLSDNDDTIASYALLPESPAANAIPIEHCPDLDQRYHYRRTGRYCDIGAFESGSRRAKSGKLSFSPARYQVQEADTEVQVVVSREEGGEGSVSVDYFDTLTGTARPHPVRGDYGPLVSGVLQWGDGDTEAKQFAVSIRDDALQERNETIVLALDNASGGALIGSAGKAVIEILDNDSAAVSTGEGKGDSSVSDDAGDDPGEAGAGSTGTESPPGTHKSDDGPPKSSGGGGAALLLGMLVGMVALWRRGRARTDLTHE
ncbi:MAG TPA: hypothetical protein ENJ43_03575 [Gammaproteobacteria bacterium]|nr:hypothetical protein [Gammaproteobacteria bacterium]